MRDSELEKAKWHLMLVMKPEEELLWYDRPSPLAEAAIPFCQSVFMALWTALALAVTLYSFASLQTNVGSGILYVTAIAGAALCAFGVTVLVWNIWMFLSAWSTFYGLSSHRLIVLKSLWPGKVLSLKAGWLTCAESGTSFIHPNLILTGRGNGKNIPDRVRIWVKNEQDSVLRALRETLSP